MNKHNYYFLKKIYVILIITFSRFTKQSWHMLAYIANFVKSLSLTFLTQPPHFEAIVGQFVMETQKKNEKANPSPLCMHVPLVSFKVGDKMVNEHSTYV